MRKFIFVLFLMSLSINSFSNDEFVIECLTHGECQERLNTREGRVCFIVKTGVDVNNQVTCALRCYTKSLGSICDKKEGELIGKCQEEEFPIPVFDPSNPDCTSAIDPIL
jgi:hypothetical protein